VHMIDQSSNMIFHDHPLRCDPPITTNARLRTRFRAPIPADCACPKPPL
jgi:hypothetical protein